ncbi:DUF6894 family protein [Sphingomonas mucosissima]|uniref:DUF6894 domain-containing protein n=1 Tax=Sphingomonas mucosissima TaxID=370959 RepID=A0A245ZRA9_9SPHN|nr:hypothetical protein [Sphingomonas mucosissima]OWK32277.1 hypothetical protein SPMU_05990 [Sphingomonas mucosissima]
MGRYFFHLRDHTDEMLDPDGVELSGIVEACSVALEAARDTLSHDMKNGVLDLRYRIDVEHAVAGLVHSLPFKQAFSVIELD